MTIRTALLFVGAVAAAVVVFALSRPSGDRPVDGAGAGGDAVAEQPEVRTGDVPAGASAGADPATRVSVTDGLAVIRGRTVDEEGQPLARVAVELRGWAANGERMNRHRLDHGEVEWEDPEDVITGADGRFEHRFDPPPPFQFACEPKADGRVRVYGRWSQIVPGSTTDMGDVVLPRGVHVVGRVVDEAGVGMPRRGVRLRRLDPERGALRVRDEGSGHTDAGGLFEVSLPLPAGEYSLRVFGCEVKAPADSVVLELPRTDLRIVVARLARVERPMIRGVVRDVRGQPVARAQILVGDDWSSPTAAARSDGTFELRQGKGVPATLATLGVAARGFVPWRSSDPVAWGASDVEIILTDGPPLTIRVRRADGGMPIERFGVILAPIDPGTQRLWRSRDLQHLGDHPAGELQIPNMTTGRFRFSAVPAESSGLPASSIQDLVIEPGVPKVVDVKLAPWAERVVEVVTTSGDPVGGVSIALLWHRDVSEIDMQSRAISPERARRESSDRPVLIDEATTDADGRATLRGRWGDVFALRLPGPGHVPVIVVPFLLSEEGIARVVVGVGGVIYGRVEPKEIVATLRKEAGLPERGPVESKRAGRQPSIFLQRAGPNRQEEFPNDSSTDGIQVGEGGSFTIAGVPPGTWDVVVRSWVARKLVGGMSGASSSSRVAAFGVAIADGEERELVLDLETWCPQPVTIIARLDGAPFTGQLDLEGVFAPLVGGQEASGYRALSLQGEERLETTLPSGSWTVGAQAIVNDVWVPLVGPAFAVVPNRPTRVDIDLRLARRAMVVLGPDEEPVRDLVLSASGVGLDLHTEAPPTDSAGRTTLLGPPCTLRLRTLHRPLTDRTSYFAWVRAEGDDQVAAARAYVDLGTVDLLPGGGAEHVVRLPAEWAELPK